MTELIEDFIDIANEARAAYPKPLPANITYLEIIQLTLKNETLLELLANNTESTVEIISNTVESIRASAKQIQELYDFYSRANESQRIIDALNTPVLYFLVFSGIHRSESYCGGRLDSGNLIATSFTPALLIILILSFMNTRLWKQKCCWGRPGLAIPVNLLDSYEDRYTYGIAFGATASRIVKIIVDNDYTLIFGEETSKEIQSSPSYSKGLINIGAAIFIGVSYYPFFACISTHQRLLGAVMGTLYSALWFLTYLFRLIDCAGSVYNTLVVEEILTDATSILFHGLLLLSFIKVLITSLISKRRGIVVSSCEWKENYKYFHVKNLLKPAPASNGTFVEVTGFKQKINSKLYHWKPDFKYSTRIICIYITGGACLYLVAVLYVIAGRKLRDFMDTVIDSLQESDERSGSPSGTNWHRVKQGIGVTIICWMIATGFAAIKDLFMVANMMSWYRGHVLRLQRGDKSFLPYNIENQKHINIMVSSFKFAGYQAGYIIWSFIITHVVLFLITSVIALGCIWPLTWGKFGDSFMPYLFTSFGPTILIAIITIVIQKLLAKFVFLRDYGAMLALNNRRLYHIASYFFFFMNIFVGIFSCLIRIFYAMLCGVLFLPRLQKSALPRDWELFDPGYKTYIGYLFLEHTHANPVLLTFTGLLWECVKDKTDSHAVADDTVMECEPEGLPPRAKIRWFLALTLINNPELKELRRREEQKPAKKKSYRVQIKEFKTKVVNTIDGIRHNVRDSKL